MNRLTFASAFLAAFGAAAAYAQTPVQNIVSGYIQCAYGALNEPGAANIVAAHLPLNATTATPEQLADNTVPSPQDAALIQRFYPRVSLCQQQLAAQLTVLAPTVGSLFSRDFQDQQGDVAVLVQRGMTWGNFTQRRQQRGRAYQAMVQNEIARLKQNEQAQQQASAAGDFITGLAKLAVGVAVVAAASRPQYVAPPVGLTIQRPVTCAQTGSVNAIVHSVTCY